MIPIPHPGREFGAIAQIDQSPSGTHTTLTTGVGSTQIVEKRAALARGGHNEIARIAAVSMSLFILPMMPHLTGK